MMNTELGNEEGFGQQLSLLPRLSRIIRDYPKGTVILKAE